MFKAFTKGFNELFGGFMVILGISGGFVGFIYLLVQVVKFLETMIGTTWAIILMSAFVVIMACIGHGLYRMSLYKKAKKSYELNKQKREEILDKFEAEANAGKGLKVKKWMRPYMTFVLPVMILILFVFSLFF